MKKRYIIFLVLCIIIFSSCSFHKVPPETVSIDHAIYKHAFSEYLFPMDYASISSSDGIRAAGMTYFKIVHSSYDCYVTYYKNAEPHIYFSEETYDEAVEYYRQTENYNYYCLLGNIHDESQAQNYSIEVDDEKFDRLIDFSTQNAYDPFTSFNHPDNLAILPISDPDHWVKDEIHLYKESCDGVFSTMKGFTFIIVEDKLVLLYSYDFSDKWNPQMSVIDVPSDLSDYFCNLIRELEKE